MLNMKLLTPQSQTKGSGNNQLTIVTFHAVFRRVRSERRQTGARSLRQQLQCWSDKYS